MEAPKVYTTAEIEMFLSGERREVDRLLLHGINSLASVLIPHIQSELSAAKVIEDLGGSEELIARTEFVKRLMLREEAKAAMMQKVAQSAVVWALMAFVGFLAAASWNYIMASVKGG